MNKYMCNIILIKENGRNKRNRGGKEIQYNLTGLLFYFINISSYTLVRLYRSIKCC